MYNCNNYEYNCTKKCKCRAHGKEITAALTKRSIADDKLAAFIAKTCCNFSEITDELGRSAVHMSASVDRYAILEWLLNQGAVINGRDKESGSSALHRAIYYGCIDCAVLLLRYGASLDLLDEDTRTPLQSCCRLRDFSDYADANVMALHGHPFRPANNELLVWGSNKNYNLGIGNEEGTLAPQFIDFFRKAHISIELVSLSAYHSLFVDAKGQLFAVGHGKGGRLGNGTENSLPVPERVKVHFKNAGEKIAGVSTSRKHSLLLTNKGAVFACGLNEDKQLGLRDCPEKQLVFKEVVSLRDFGVKNLKRVIARDFHSLVHSDTVMYVWGTNYGQFGWSSGGETVIPVPRQMKLPEGTRIAFVESNNFAIACYTEAKSVLLFYNYKLKAIKPPQIEALKSLSIVGGDNTKLSKGSPSGLKILMLTEINVVFIWYEVSQQYLRCTFSQIRINQIDKIFYKANQVLILSSGDVYTGKCRQIPLEVYKEGTDDAWFTHGQPRRDICGRQKIRIDLTHISHLDRAVDVFCDDEFSSFAVLQECFMKYFSLPKLIPEEYSFKKLLNNASASDGIHDVVLHVDGELFYGHKFIIFSRSPGLKEIISPYTDKDVHLAFTGLTSKMFEIILNHIYTNYLVTEDDFDDIQQSLGPMCPTERWQIIKVFLCYVEMFQLTSLAEYVKSNANQFPSFVDKSKCRFNRLKRRDYPQLYDVTIRCAGDVEISAHKCILVSQLEYFDLMFTHTWSERSTINLTTVPSEYMIPIVDFLYSCDAEHIRRQNYSGTFLYNMVVFCDQFFIEHLRKVCEVLILEKINIRKCGEMLDFACLYNCNILKAGCLDFICQNLYRVLSQRVLEFCDPVSLSCINAHYRKMFKAVFDYRMITPDSDAVDDDILLSYVDDFEVDLDFRMDEEEIIKIQAKHKQKLNKAKLLTRQYEMDAINSMKELNLRESLSNCKTDKSEAQKDAEVSSAKIQDEYKAWMQVGAKKEVKKKPAPVAPSFVNANEVLKVELKPKEELVPLKEPLEKPVLDDRTTNKVTNFNLGDFTPIKSEKLSQKQRKRLVSESWRGEAPPTSTPSKPIPVAQPQTPNAWGISSPPTGSEYDSTSFANMMRSPSSLPQDSPLKRNDSSGPSPSTSGTSFSQILEDEKKQREYVDKMRNKSLILTQIEETAITELRAFYNVDDAADEIITIERKRRPVTMNFAIWQKN